jgi:hypothetical protein
VQKKGATYFFIKLSEKLTIIGEKFGVMDIMDSMGANIIF